MQKAEGAVETARAARWDRFRRIRRLAGLTWLVLGFSENVAANEPAVGCDNARIAVEEPIAARWADAISRLCGGFGKSAAVAPGSRLRLGRGSSDDELVVEARLGDDRVATRRIQSPDELAAVVDALTIVIPDDAPAVAPAPPPPPKRAPAAAQPPRTPLAASAAQPPRTPLAADRMRAELGLAIDGRLSGSPLYLSLAGDLYAGLRAGRWLFGIAARWQPSEVPASAPQKGFEMESAGAGFLVLYRVLHAPLVDLDAGGSVLMLVDTQSIDTRLPDEVGSSTDARFGALVRALFGKGGVRFAPSLDADIAPTRVRRNIHLKADLPPLPSWSVAIGLGVSWVNL
jgi:hypothetical protein